MSQPDDPLLDVAEAALKELGRRFETDAASIPSHVLSKVAADTMRVIDRREKKNPEGEDSEPFSLIDELDTLPQERGDELLAAEIDRVEMELTQLQEVWDARQVRLSSTVEREVQSQNGGKRNDEGS